MTAQRMRERPVPCLLCGVSTFHGRSEVRTLTWNLSGRCLDHESLGAQLAALAEARYDRP